jgi:peptidoglycan/xylan/chitin deacetylase (PgdA/CDA1 family)
MHSTHKQFALALLSGAGILRVGRWCSRHRLVVLTYHKVLPDDYSDAAARPPDSLFRWEFEQQVAHLVRWYHVTTGEEVRAFLAGDMQLPDYAVLITFDDGYENNYTVALPILQRYGAHAMFFLTTRYIGQPDATLWFDRLSALLCTVPFSDILPRLPAYGVPGDIRHASQLRRWLKGLSQLQRERLITALEDMLTPGRGVTREQVASRLMTWDQVRDMAAQGMTIGSHTASHQILAMASPDDVRHELRLSRQHIEDEIGQPCWGFCYPNGTAADFRPADKAAVKAAGYTCAFTQIPGSITRGTDAYALPRMAIPDAGDMRVFRSRLTGVHAALQSAFGTF